MKKKQLTILLPEDTDKAIRNIAKNDCRSISDSIRELVEKEAKKRGIK